MFNLSEYKALSKKKQNMLSDKKQLVNKTY